MKERKTKRENTMAVHWENIVEKKDKKDNQDKQAGEKRQAWKIYRSKNEKLEK